MRKEFNKLVRDLIPEQIEKDGRKAYIHTLDTKEMILCLEDKLVEEVNEYLKDGTVEELADIVEVIYAICKVKEISYEELERTRIEKQIANGGFERKIFLEYTEVQ